MRRRGAPSRRRYRRLTLRVMVEYTSSDGLREDPATTLGAGGLFIATESPLPEGSRLKLRFRLPGTERDWELEGRVAWAAGAEARPAGSCGMGIEFTDRSCVARLARTLESFGRPES